jgi:hypothetical protein
MACPCIQKVTTPHILGLLLAILCCVSALFSLIDAGLLSKKSTLEGKRLYQADNTVIQFTRNLSRHFILSVDQICM